MSQNLTLVTGASGFIAGHIIEELLKHGFRVRGTLRSAKYQTFVNTVKVPGLEFVEVDDISSGDLTNALKGIDAIIHAACPLPGRSNLDETFKKNKGDKYYVYFTAKIKAEKALWAFANEHPELEVATRVFSMFFLPGYVIGPYPKTFPLPLSVDTMGTNDFVHIILNKGDPPFAPNWMVDVRDVAKAHVLAFEKLPLPANDPRRFLVNCKTNTWGNAATYIKNSRPELADRIIPLEDIKPLPAYFRAWTQLGHGKF